MKSATLFALLASATARAPPPPPSSKPQLSPPTKPILSPYVREVYLRAVDRKIQKDTAHAEWYSANGERVLTRMLDYMLGGEIPEDSGPWGERDEQALWLLCRTLLGCIEAALLELGDASARVNRARKRWRSHGSPSQAFGEAIGEASATIGGVAASLGAAALDAVQRATEPDRAPPSRAPSRDYEDFSEVRDV